MLLLVQKSASGAVDQERCGNSRTNNSVSMELLDDQGGKVPETFSKMTAEDVCEELAPLKWVRVGNVLSQGETGVSR